MYWLREPHRPSCMRRPIFAGAWRRALPKSLDTIYGSAEVFAKQVKDMSGGKFEISVHAGGELMPAFGIVDGVQNATVECGHTAPYYYFGKDPTFAMDTAIPFGLNSRQMTAWMYEGNGLKLFREFYAAVQHRPVPDGQHRRADGRLVPQGDQVAGRHQGPEDAHRRLCRQGARAPRRRVAEPARPARSTRRWRRARSMLPNGSAPTTTRSSASTRSRRTTTTPAGGKAGRSSICTSTTRRGPRCRPSTRRWSKTPPRTHTP